MNSSSSTSMCPTDMSCGRRLFLRRGKRSATQGVLDGAAELQEDFPAGLQGAFAGGFSRMDGDLLLRALGLEGRSGQSGAVVKIHDRILSPGIAHFCRNVDGSR